MEFMSGDRSERTANESQTPGTSRLLPRGAIATGLRTCDAGAVVLIPGRVRPIAAARLRQMADLNQQVSNLNLEKSNLTTEKTKLLEEQEEMIAKLE